MIRVALDALGGDFAPDVVVEGAVNAVNKNPNVHVVLCGPEAVVKEKLAKLGYAGQGISVVDAPDPVAMDEHPVQVLKKKPHSGLVTCVALQKKGMVDASVSAGNSGAMMASCLMLLGKSSEKFSRPHMGEEEHKGPAVLQEAHQLLKSAPVNFIGNIEGETLIMGAADVVVTSGFTGNVVLKMLEGFFELHQKMFGTIDTEAGRRFAEMWDYRMTGGALLLGLNGTGIIAHGRSDALAIEKAVEVAAKYAEKGVSKNVNERLAAIKDDPAEAK